MIRSISTGCISAACVAFAACAAPAADSRSEPNPQPTPAVDDGEEAVPVALEPELGDPPTEADYYAIEPIAIPDGVVLEVAGLAILPDGRPLVSTRRGEVFIVEDAYEDEPTFVRFADGLQEPLGLLVHDDGWIYAVQRGELSRMRDVNGDDKVDRIEAVCDEWRLSGNYHEYNFGPRLDSEGNFWITTNKPFGSQPFGEVIWRGFALRITPEGEMIPTVSGLRSPAGVEVSPWGDVFYTDNQGEWCGASKLSHLVPGSFQGHPHGLPSCDDPRWPYDKPTVPNGVPMPEVAERIETFQLPAVWFPYDKMGKSPAGFVWDRSDGEFGPFAGQVFVTDQHHASVMRVCLERVRGHWQGACFPFREGFASGALRVAWGTAGTLFVGMTNRGWGSKGVKTDGLARLEWTGRTPFEIREMRATPDGFELAFTRPADVASASDIGAYAFESYTYLLHSDYGSPEVDRAVPTVVAADVADDARSVRLRVDGLRTGYVHELHASGVRSEGGWPLLHPEAYYTLIEIPDARAK